MVHPWQQYSKLYTRKLLSPIMQHELQTVLSLQGRSVPRKKINTWTEFFLVRIEHIENNLGVVSKYQHYLLGDLFAKSSRMRWFSRSKREFSSLLSANS